MTNEEIISLYEDGMTQKDIGKAAGKTSDAISRVIGEYLERKQEELLRKQRAINRKPEIFRAVYEGKEYQDVTDLWLDRPCICREPVKEGKWRY
jgi:hypothetical protein